VLRHVAGPASTGSRARMRRSATVLSLNEGEALSSFKNASGARRADTMSDSVKPGTPRSSEARCRPATLVVH